MLGFLFCLAAGGAAVYFLQKADIECENINHPLARPSKPAPIRAAAKREDRTPVTIGQFVRQ